ncbi:hypothetical protein WKK05_14550 [Nostoc sp. UHCC 0302]|uniref:hypothetical protein n=1 Tax=Nostoc sp. UHCC 0302 TaxID=3134896 RepID=UPI00311CBDEC
MTNVNAMNLQLTNQSGLWTQFTQVKSVKIVANNTVFDYKETVNVQQEVEELKKLRESVTGIEEYIKRKAAFKAHLKAISGHLCDSYRNDLQIKLGCVKEIENN